MDLPYLVLHFALNSGLDITREGFPFQDTPKSMPSLEAGPSSSWDWLLFTQCWHYLNMALPKQCCWLWRSCGRQLAQKVRLDWS